VVADRRSSSTSSDGLEGGGGGETVGQLKEWEAQKGKTGGGTDTLPTHFIRNITFEKGDEDKRGGRKKEV